MPYDFTHKKWVYSDSEKAAMARRAAAGWPSLKTKGLLGYLTVRTWGGTTTDKTETKNVEERTGAKKGQVRVTKTLPTKEELEPWNQVVRNITATFEQWSAPSDEISKGSRFFRSKCVAPFKEQFDKLMVQADQIKMDFKRIYPNILKDGKNRLGDMWDPTRYPSEEEIGDYFEVKFEFRPLPAQEQVKFEDLSEEEQERVRQSIEDGCREFLDNTRKGARKKTKEAVTHLVKRVGALLARKQGEGNGRFYDSVIDNLREVVQNVTSDDTFDLKEDEELDKAMKEIEEKLLKYSPAQIRGDNAAATEVLTDAKEIENKLRDWE